MVMSDWERSILVFASAPLVVFLGESQNAFLEIGRVRRIGLPTTLLEGWKLSSLAVILGELMDATAANIKLLGNERCVHFVIDDSCTNAGDIVMI